MNQSDTKSAVGAILQTQSNFFVTFHYSLKKLHLRLELSEPQTGDFQTTNSYTFTLPVRQCAVQIYLFSFKRTAAATDQSPCNRKRNV